MQQRILKFFAHPFYPLVLSTYPVLYLLSVNVGQVDPAAGLRPLLISLLLCSVLFLVLRLLLRDWHRAAFLCTLWLALFFSYGHVYNLLSARYPDVDLRPYMLGAVALLAVLAAVWTTRPRLSFVSSAASLNVIALALVLMSLGQVAFAARPRSPHSLPADHAPVQPDLVLPENPPDVYYFLLDSYTRADLLEKAYGYDNSDFIQALEARGFYVAACSQSNYGRTELSLASTLNMSYLQGLDGEFVPDNIGRLTLWDSLKHSAVRRNFENLGYKIVNFASGFAFIELRDADAFLSPPPLASGFTEFEGLFVGTTLARHLKDLGWLDPDALLAQNFRDRFQFIFSSMHRLAAMPEPTFAYIHVMSPHPPFVFGPDGEPTDPAEFWNEKRLYPAALYAQGYQNQTTYLDKRLLEAIDTLLAESPQPPVIILQGDHGPWVQPNPQHFMILNAYYLPGHMDRLYPQISPVNTFRMVFDAYLGGKYDMLDDVSYHSPVPNLFDFTEVPNPCK
ncbi:MAG TPA: sulfatase-like hydrolase/transferase [Anaerolineales bacterium]|jgi:hypothetical protein